MTEKTRAEQEIIDELNRLQGMIAGVAAYVAHSCPPLAVDRIRDVQGWATMHALPIDSPTPTYHPSRVAARMISRIQGHAVAERNSQLPDLAAVLREMARSSALDSEE